MALDQAGVQFIAQGANQYIADVGNAARATTSMSSQISSAASNASKSAGLFGSLGNAIAGVGKIAAGFVVGQAVLGLPRFLISAANAAKDEEAASIRLDQAIKNLGDGVTTTTKHMTGLTAEQQNSIDVTKAATADYEQQIKSLQNQKQAITLSLQSYLQNTKVTSANKQAIADHKNEVAKQKTAIDQQILTLKRYIDDMVPATELQKMFTDANKDTVIAVQEVGRSYQENVALYNKEIERGKDLAFGMSEQRQALALLTAETGSSTKTLERYRLAQDLARGTGMDLVTASRLLGKVTDENVNVLARYGIKVEKGADDTALFGAIQAKFGGQAQAFANSTAGMMGRVSVAMDELKDRIGSFLLPIMVKLADFTLKTIVPTFEHLIDVAERFGGKAVAAFDDVRGAVEKTAREGAKFSLFGQKIDIPKLDLNTVSSLVQASTAVIALAIALPGPMGILGAILSTIFTPMGAVIAGIAAAFVLFGQQAHDAFKFVVDGVDSLLRKLNDLSGGILGNVAKDLSDFSKDVTNILFHGDTLSSKESKALGKRIMDDIAAGAETGASLQDTIDKVLAEGNPRESAKAIRNEIRSNAVSTNPLFQPGAGTPVVFSVLQALDNAPAPTGKGSLLDRVKELGNSLNTDLQPGLDKLKDISHYFTLGLGGGEIGGAHTGTEVTFFQIGSFIRTDIIPTIDDAQNRISKFIGDFQRGLTNQGPPVAFGPTIPGGQVPGQQQGIGYQISSGIRSAIPDIEKAMDELTGYLQGKLKELLDSPWGKAFENLVTAGQIAVHALVTVFGPTLSSVYDAAVSATKIFVDTFVGLTKVIVDVLALDFPKAWSDFKALIGNLAGDTAGVFRGLGDAILSFVKGLFSLGEEAGNQLAQGLYKAFPILMGAAHDAVSTILDAIGGTADWLFNGGKWIVDQIIKGTSGMIASLYKIGSDFADSIWEGIKGAGPTIFKLIEQWAEDNIPGPIKWALKQFSPSRVGLDIGENFGNAIAMGIDSATPNVTDSMTELQRQMMFGGGEQGAFLSGLQGYLTGQPVAPEWTAAYGKVGQTLANSLNKNFAQTVQYGSTVVSNSLSSSINSSATDSIPDATAAGKSIGDAITSGVSDGLSDLSSTVSGSVKSAMASVQNGGVISTTDQNGNFTGYATAASGGIKYTNNGNTVVTPGGSVSGALTFYWDDGTGPHPWPQNYIGGRYWGMGIGSATPTTHAQALAMAAAAGVYPGPMGFSTGGYVAKPMFAKIGDAPGGEFVLTSKQMMGLISMIPRSGGQSGSWAQSNLTIQNVSLPGVTNVRQFIDELNNLQRKDSAMRLRLGARGVSL